MTHPVERHACTLRATLDDLYPHGRIHDRGRTVGMWVAHPGRCGEGPSLDVLGIVRFGRHLALHRTVSGRGHAAAREAVEACRSRPIPISLSSPFPADLREDIRAVVALMAATLAGDTNRDWFVPRTHDVASDLSGMHPSAAGNQVEAVARAWVAAIHCDVAAFLSTLDPDAVRLAGRVRVRAAFPGQAWGAFDRTFTDGAPLARALDWMPDMPILLGRLWRDEPDAMTACADGRDLSVLVAKRLSADEVTAPRMLGPLAAALDAMRGIPDERAVAMRNAIEVPHWGEDKVVAVVDMLRELPENWIPATGTEWLSYLETGHQVLGKALQATLDKPSLVHLVGAGRGWVDLERRVTVATGGGRLSSTEVRARLDGIGDLTKAFAHQVAIPCVAAGRGLGQGDRLPAATVQHMADAVDLMLRSNRSLVRLLEWSTRWHGRQAAIQARLESLKRERPWRTGWAPAFPDAGVDGYEIVVLRDAAALSVEGLTLGHCVGGYSPECHAGTSRILSLRKEGRRLSTAELRLEGDDVVLIQHRGPGNGDPTPAEAAALAAYLDGIRSGARPWTPADLEPVPAEGGPDIARNAGYEWWQAGHVEAALDAWRTSLPRSLRDMDKDAWSAALDPAAADGSRPRPDPRPAGPAEDTT